MSTLVMQVAAELESSKWRKLLLNGALILFGLTAPLAVAECALRLSHYRMTTFDDSAFRQSAWSFRPNSHQDSYIGAPVTINNLGLRGPDTTLAKPPGVFRILGVGDSITFGYGVRVEDTFLRVLEQDLNASAPAGARYEVINAGVPATGLEYYTHFIENNAPAMHPDLIVVNMALNDIDPLLDPEPVEPHAHLTPFRSLNAFLFFHSRLYNMVYVRAKSLLYRLNVLHLEDNEGFGFLSIEPPSPAQDKARAGVNRYIQRMANFARSHRVPLAIVVFPVEPQLSERALKLYAQQLHLYFGPEVLRGQPQGWIEQIGATNGVPVLDLLPALRAGDNGQLFLRNQSISVDPVHPSPAGHRIAGDEIARFLKSPGVGLIP
jgi:lysophospholipase L1-like esterase